MKLYLIIVLFLLGVCTGAAVEEAQKRILALHSEGGMAVTQQSATQEGSFEYHVTALKKTDSQIEEKKFDLSARSITRMDMQMMITSF